MRASICYYLQSENLCKNLLVPVLLNSVRGPLKLLKEKFQSNDETPLNLLQYVSDFRNRLSRACEVARSNLKTSQGKIKARYDNHVVDRKFKPGDKVLALLPIPGRPLQAKYFGPYTIDKKTSDLTLSQISPGFYVYAVQVF